MTQDNIKHILKERITFLNESDIESFIGITKYLKKDNKEIILESGNKSKKAFLILRGTIRGFIFNPKSEEKNIIIRSEGIFIGDVRNLFDNTPQRLSFKTIGETHILIFNFRDFEALANTNSNIMQLYLNILKEAVVRLTYRVETLITMTNEERYLDLLKLNPNFLNRAYSKHIANFLGITPVSLSRIIKRITENKT